MKTEKEALIKLREAQKQLDGVRNLLQQIEARHSKENGSVSDSADKARPVGETNTAILQLLSDIKELFDKVGYIMMTKDSEMYRRIDAVLAQQQHG